MIQNAMCQTSKKCKQSTWHSLIHLAMPQCWSEIKPLWPCKQTVYKHILFLLPPILFDNFLQSHLPSKIVEYSVSFKFVKTTIIWVSVDLIGLLLAVTDVSTVVEVISIFTLTKKISDKYEFYIIVQSMVYFASHLSRKVETILESFKWLENHP